MGDIHVILLPSLENEFVVVGLHTTCLFCIWIQRSTRKYYQVRAYRIYPCDRYQIGRGILFNATWIGTSISTFLKTYHIEHAFISFMPDITSVKHGFVSCTTALPSAQDFASYKTRGTLHAYDYLYPHDDTFLFYWYHIPYTLLMQYMCLAITYAFNCIRITPRFCALLYAYRMIQGAAFRQSQLALDMHTIDNRISRYFTPDIITQSVHGIDAPLLQNRVALLDTIAACGLLHCQKE